MCHNQTHIEALRSSLNNETVDAILASMQQVISNIAALQFDAAHSAWRYSQSSRSNVALGWPEFWDAGLAWTPRWWVLVLFFVCALPLTVTIALWKECDATVIDEPPLEPPLEHHNGSLALLYQNTKPANPVWRDRDRLSSLRMNYSQAQIPRRAKQRLSEPVSCA